MSTSSEATAARKSFATRLRNLRRDAGLTGRQLAELTGIHNTKISRIEHARLAPSENEIRQWAIACGVARQIPELIAVHREVEQMWSQYRHELRAGMVHVQSRSQALYEQTGLLRAYESNIVPGILQTRGYVLAGLATSAKVLDQPPQDVEPAAEARLTRQHLVTWPTGRNNYMFVIEIGALEHGFGGAAVMAEQLDFLAEVTRLPNVSLGIVPLRADRKVRPGEGFYIFDDHLVRSETWSGMFRTRRREDIDLYLKVFTMLADLAVYGHQARELISGARRRFENS